jgi:hypothetical protein
MGRIPRTIANRRPGQSISAIIQGRRIVFRGPAGTLRKSRPFLSDT